MLGSEMHDELISVLEQINGMLDYNTRTYLVDALSQREQEGIKRHEGNMAIDLHYIVEHFTYVDKLEVLIERAKYIAQSPRIRGKLDECLIKFKIKQQQSIRDHAQTVSTIGENLHQPDADSVEFDVFLCHNSEDRPTVKAIGERLKELGLRPWLDEWEVPPFAPWQDELQKAIPRMKAVAVFVGPSGVGPWQDIEIKAFLQKFAQRKIRIGLVFLPSCPDQPELPLFLEIFNWVDFRKDDPDPMEQLIWGITGKKPY